MLAGPAVRGGDDTQCNICPRMFSVTSHFLLPLLLSQHTIIPPPVTPTKRIIPVHQPRLSHQRFCTKKEKTAHVYLRPLICCVKILLSTSILDKPGNWKHIGENPEPSIQKSSEKISEKTGSNAESPVHLKGSRASHSTSIILE